MTRNGGRRTDGTSVSLTKRQLMVVPYQNAHALSKPHASRLHRIAEKFLPGMALRWSCNAPVSLPT